MIDYLIIFPADKQLFFLHYISHHALPAAPLRQREEPGDPHSLDHDDICRSVDHLSVLVQFIEFLNKLLSPNSLWQMNISPSVIVWLKNVENHPPYPLRGKIIHKKKKQS